MEKARNDAYHGRRRDARHTISGQDEGRRVMNIYTVCDAHSIECTIIFWFLGLAELTPILLPLLAIVGGLAIWSAIRNKRARVNDLQS